MSATESIFFLFVACSMVTMYQQKDHKRADKDQGCIEVPCDDADDRLGCLSMKKPLSVSNVRIKVRSQNDHLLPER